MNLKETILVVCVVLSAIFMSVLNNSIVTTSVGSIGIIFICSIMSSRLEEKGDKRGVVHLLESVSILVSMYYMVSILELYVGVL